MFWLEKNFVEINKYIYIYIQKCSIEPEIVTVLLRLKKPDELQVNRTSIICVCDEN